MRKSDLFTSYDLPPKNCTHTICDGELCIVNPIPLRATMEWKFVSCLWVPMLGGFQREKEGRPLKVVYIKKVKGKKVKLADEEEVVDFITEHGLSLGVDLFCFDPSVECKRTLDRNTWWKKCMVEDVSNGQELLQIPAVNMVDDEVPVIDEYLTTSVFVDEKRHARRIQVCCDCTDNCKDKLKCACFLQTLRVYNPDERKAFRSDLDIGYQYKRLPQRKQNMSGIYECNARCQCNDQCLNRVVQYAPKWKLQLFKDEAILEKGWGVRALNDIPEGAFVAVYTGAMSQESEANLKTLNLDWMTSGMWKYIVNMQVIQSAGKDLGKLRGPDTRPEKGRKGGKKQGKGKESDAKKTDNDEPKGTVISFGALDFMAVFDISELAKEKTHPSAATLEEKTGSWLARNVTQWELLRDIVKTKREQAIRENIEADLAMQLTGTTSGDFVTYRAADKSIYRIPFKSDPDKRSRKRRRDTEDAKNHKLMKRLKSDGPIPKEFNPIVKVTQVLDYIRRFQVYPELPKEKKDFSSLKLLESINEENDENRPVKAKGKKGKCGPRIEAGLGPSGSSKGTKGQKDPTATASTSKTDDTTTVKPSLPIPLPLSPRKEQLCITGSNKKSDEKSVKQLKKGKYTLRGSAKPRNYTFTEYDDMLKVPRKNAIVGPKIKISHDLYLIDGQRQGNIGRYFNHSCVPNLFCQYVFVDNQDVRFPVVAFFAVRNIKAGEELVWCYNYDDDLDMGIDPVECKCGSGDKCRGILIC